MPRPSKRPPSGIGSALEPLVARIDDRIAGRQSLDTLATGYASLDRMLGGGLRRQDLIVLGGDVGSGKSALALSLALRAAASGIPTLFLSGEMSSERVLERALAIEGRASVDELRLGQLDDGGRSRVAAAAVKLRDLPLMVRPLTGAAPDEIQSHLEVVPPRQLVVVDSLQLVASPRAAGRLEERTALSARALKSLAIERNIALVATSQLGHHRAERADPRPTLADLGALGTVRELADLVLMIFREEMYRPGQGVEGATELILAKNRNGPTGFVDLFFYPQWLRFVDMLDPD
jgi:replicative DNA helicase